MKLASLMAGAAALALVAAPAMAGTVNQGAAVGGFSKGMYGAYTSANGTTAPRRYAGSTERTGVPVAFTR